jgi:hypothetical protein
MLWLVYRMEAVLGELLLRVVMQVGCFPEDC